MQICWPYFFALAKQPLIPPDWCLKPSLNASKVFMCRVDQDVAFNPGNDRRHNQNTAPAATEPVSSKFPRCLAVFLMPIGYMGLAKHFVACAGRDGDFNIVLVIWQNPIVMNELFQHGRRIMLTRVDYWLTNSMPPASNSPGTFARKYRKLPVRVTNPE